MLNIDIYSEQLLHGLALHRFNVHTEEIKRVLTPILNEVYQYGQDKGFAEAKNNFEPTVVTVDKKLSDIIKEDAEDYFSHVEHNDDVVIPAGD